MSELASDLGNIVESKSGAIYSLLPILNYFDALSELKLNKSYIIYTLEKYIPLLQFSKYIMLRSFLKFEINLRHYVIFKTLNFIHMNSSGSFHPTSDVMSDLYVNCILDVSCTGQIWLSTHIEKDALSSK